MRLLQIDAFTSQAFRGNPAAVCLLDGEHDERWMQDVAAEMNLSETAFLQRRDDGDYGLRWFTPAVEVALCGHATLASAHALYEEHGLSSARFHTKSGVLTADRVGGRIELDFPAIAEILGPTSLAVQFGYVDGPALWPVLTEWKNAIAAASTATLANRLLELCGIDLLLREFTIPFTIPCQAPEMDRAQLRVAEC